MHSMHVKCAFRLNSIRSNLCESKHLNGQFEKNRKEVEPKIYMKFKPVEQGQQQQEPPLSHMHTAQTTWAEVNFSPKNHKQRALVGNYASEYAKDERQNFFLFRSSHLAFFSHTTIHQYFSSIHLHLFIQNEKESSTIRSTDQSMSFYRSFCVDITFPFHLHPKCAAFDVHSTNSRMFFGSFS